MIPIVINSLRDGDTHMYNGIVDKSNSKKPCAGLGL